MRRIVGLGILALAAACGDDDAGAARDAGSTSTDGGDSAVGAGSDTGPDAAGVNHCLDPETQSPPCCYERSNADRQEIELVIRSMRFEAPFAAANAVFESQIQEAFDDGRVPWLLEVRQQGGQLVLRTGFGVRDAAAESYRFAESGAPGPGAADRWRPVSAAARLEGNLLSAGATEDLLLIPLIGGGDPAPELPFREVGFPAAHLTEDHSCVGERTPSGRWTSGDPPSHVEAFIRVDDAESVSIGALGGVSFCSVLAAGGCDRPRSEWDPDNLPDARCDDAAGCSHTPDTCVRDSDDAATQCDAWWFSATFVAAGVEIVTP